VGPTSLFDLQPTATNNEVGRLSHVNQLHSGMFLYSARIKKNKFIKIEVLTETGVAYPPQFFAPLSACIICHVLYSAGI